MNTERMSMTEALSEAFKLGRDYEQHLPQPTDAEHDGLGEWASEELERLAAAVQAE